MSGVELKLLDADELDYPAYAQLQKAAFAEIFLKNRVKDDYLTAEFFAWKYHTAAGNSKIAVIYDGDTMIAANAMMCYQLQLPSGQSRAWQSCDTASLPAARGRGYFKQCLKGLLTLIETDEIFFGFPNANSRKGFLGIGWTELSLLNTFVKPWFLSPFRGLGGVSVSRIAEPGLDEFLQNWMNQQHQAMVVRDSSYLHWRYFSQPNSPYFALYGRRGGTLISVAIARLAQVLGRKVVLLMEAMGATERDERNIRESAARWGFRQGASLAVDINNHSTLWGGLRGGFVRVPQALIPKRNVLMGAAKDPAVQRQLSRPWYVSVGDWDGF